MDLATLSGSLKTRLRAWGDWARARRFWLECTSTGLLLTLAAVLFGVDARRDTSVLEERAAALEQVRARADRWAAEILPAMPAESLAWRESLEQLRELRARSAEPLRVAEEIVERGGEVGVPGVSARAETTDTITPPSPLSSGVWTVETAPTTLAVVFPGPLSSFAGFVSALPPTVRLWSARYATEGESGRGELLLLLMKIDSVP